MPDENDCLDIKICEDVLDINISDEIFDICIDGNTQLGVGTYIIEVPNGLINGINNIFTLTNIPTNNTQKVYLNGLLQMVGISKDYTISGNTITFIKAPKINNKIIVSYFKV